MNPNQRKRQGMVLLIVLGMLGLFSLLAVTYMVYSGQSRTSGLIINRAKLTNPGKILYDPNIILQVLRGSADTQSAFAGHSLLGDIYGRRPIEGNVRRYINGTNTDVGDTPLFNNWNDTSMGAVLLGSGNLAPGSLVSSDLPFCKIPVDVNCIINDVSQRLNHIDDAYNARVFTMLEGPLAGYSFRVLKYIGDENRIILSDPVPDGTPAGTPTFGIPTDSLAYSILINFQELPQDTVLEGDVSAAQAPPATPTKLRGTLGDFLSYSPNTLFYRTNGEGYKFLINDAVYNGMGYGQDPSTGNLTQQVTNPITGTYFSNQVGAALLPSYDYNPSLSDINGSTNEGFDVADYRDFWLSHNNPNADTNYLASEIIPSYHRPELVNYIWRSRAPNLAALGALPLLELREMLIQIDWACARPLPIVLVIGGVPTPVVPGRPANANFIAGKLPSLRVNFDNWPADAPLVYSFLEKLTGWIDDNGDSIGDSIWDVDNDGDGIADSVWIDPGLPLITAPDGKMLKPMAAVHIVDLDSRINLNLAGDMYQAYDSPDRYLPSGGIYVPPSGSYQTFDKQNVDERVGRSYVPTDYNASPYLSQGIGVGPAEIQFGHLFQNSGNTHYANRYTDQQNFVRAIMRARQSVSAPGPAPDRFRFTGYPGRQTERIDTTLYGGNDLAGRVMQPVPHVDNDDDSVYAWSSAAGTLFPTYGMPLMTRGKASLTLDRRGNPTVVHPDLYDPAGPTPLPYRTGDLIDDPYELSQDAQAEDAPFTLEELERVLRRFDGDISNLSDRLSSIIKQDTNPASNRYSLMSEINKVITTRSHELRNLSIGFPGRDQTNNSILGISNEPVGDMLRWLALLHEHHYRYIDTTQTTETVGGHDPSAVKNNTARYTLPPLSPDILRALFPIEFRYGLRMDINRPFGNGIDTNSNGVVDEPRELGVGINPAYFDEKGTAWTSEGLPNVNGTYNQHGFDEDPSVNDYRYYPNDGSGLAQQDLTEPFPGSRNNSGFDSTSRQLYARQLYCLAQLLIPQDYELPLMEDLRGSPPNLNRAWYKRRARILAQWAVNVVDFRDSDAVMTRFSYDYLPFGVGTHHSNPAKAPGWNPDHGDVVWGMEYPELLISETFAQHDKRVRVRTEAGSPKPVQFRIPQGSLFVELYNPRTPPQVPTAANSIEQPALPKELYYYDTATNTVKLQLSKLAPPSTFDARYGRQPVWRIGVTPPTATATGPASTQDQLLNQFGPIANITTPLPTNQLSERGNVNNYLNNSVDVVNLNGLVDDVKRSEPVGAIPASAPQLEFERMIWFTNQPPDAAIYGSITRIPNLIDQGNSTTLRNRVFYNKVESAPDLAALIPVGGYTVLAPRENTFVGSKVSTRAQTDPWNEPSPQRITYRRTTTGALEVTRLDGSITSAKFANALVNPTVLIEQTEPPAGWIGTATEPLKSNYFYNGTYGAEGIGLNISEPLPTSATDYYKMPLARVNTNDTAPAVAATAFPGGFGATTMRPDGYTDWGLNPAADGEADIFDDQNPPKINPILANFDLEHRTHNDFRQLYLQRLADPMQAYDPVWNPYITIDVMPVDLNLFTGENHPQQYDGTITRGDGEADFAFESRFKDGRSMHEHIGVTVDNATPPVIDPITPLVPTFSNFITRSHFSASTARLYQTPRKTAFISPAAGAVCFPREIGLHRPNGTTHNVSSMTLGYLNVGHQIVADAAAFNPTTYAPLGLQFDGFGPPQRNVDPLGNPGIYPNLAGSCDPNFYNLVGLFWPNRPFANATELTQVPFTAPGMFGSQYTHSLSPIITNVYGDKDIATPRFATAFGHLLNFFDIKQIYNGATVGTPTPAAGPAAELTVPRREAYWMRSPPTTSSMRSCLGYLLELVETAPLYKETAKILDPRATDITATDTTFGANTQTYAGPIADAGGNVNVIRRRMLADYRFPNNKQWTYTNPGKININTTADERVLKGLESLADTDPSAHLAATATGQVPVTPHSGSTPTFWSQFRQHLRGYEYDLAVANTNKPKNLAGSQNIQPNMDNRIPSQFVGAFQSPFNAGITPPILAANLDKFRTNLPITTTLRRPSDITNPISSTTPTSVSLLSPNRVPEREYLGMPFSMYQRFSRLTNLTTNQSNVFAVWVTVGLFEWDPVNGLGKEYVGTDGKTDRTRSFYIIDRTVPVAYREGNTFNTEKAILLRRNISRRN